MTESSDAGPQPLDALMIRLNLTNHDLVAASPDQLTHKVVAKGRRGRKLTPNAQKKVLSALKTVCPDEQITLQKLFNY